MFSHPKQFKAASRSPSKSEDVSRLLSLEDIPTWRWAYSLGDLPNNWTGVLYGPYTQPIDPGNMMHRDSATGGNDSSPMQDSNFRISSASQKKQQ